MSPVGTGRHHSANGRVGSWRDSASASGRTTLLRRSLVLISPDCQITADVPACGIGVFAPYNRNARRENGQFWPPAKFIVHGAYAAGASRAELRAAGTTGPALC